jgi:hypothetical protein
MTRIPSIFAAAMILAAASAPAFADGELDWNFSNPPPEASLPDPFTVLERGDIPHAGNSQMPDTSQYTGPTIYFPSGESASDTPILGYQWSFD